MKTLTHFSSTLILLIGLGFLSISMLQAQKWSASSYVIQQNGSAFTLNGKTCKHIGAEIYQCSGTGDEFFFVKKDRKQIVLLRGGDFNRKITLNQQVTGQASKSSTTGSATTSSSSSAPKNPTKTAGITPSETSPDINALGADGQNELHAAIKAGDSQKVQKLIKDGASPKVKNSQNQSPLDLAVSQKNASMVKTLVEARAIPMNAGHSSHPVFVKVIQSGDQGLVQAFFDGGYNIKGNTTYIKEALDTGDSQIIQTLVEQDVNVSAGLQAVTARGDYGTFRLLMNSESGTELSRSTYQEGLNKFPADQHAAFTELALDKGMNKQEALAATLGSDKLELTELVLSKGGDVGTAMYHGISRKNYTLVERCIDNHGGNVDMPISAAIDSRDLRMATLALDRGADPDKHIAAASGKGSMEILGLLIRRNGDPNLGMVPAIENQQQAAFELLIAKNARVDNDQYLVRIVETGSQRMTRTLLDRQKEVSGVANPNPGMLPAIQRGDEGIVLILIDEYAADATPATYIKDATKSNQFDITKKLVENGADPQEGLIHAIEGNYVKLATYLVGQEADASADRYMLAATDTDNREMVQLVLDEGADAEVGMVRAVNQGKSSAAATLLNGGADASNQEYLITAVHQSYSKIVVLLIEKGADPFFVDAQTGRTLLHIACNNGSLATSDHLIRAGNKVNAKDLMGNTPLHLAVPIGREVVDLVELLIAAGADVNASNNAGEKVLKVATRKGKVRKVLRDAGAKRK